MRTLIWCPAWSAERPLRACGDGAGSRARDRVYGQGRRHPGSTLSRDHRHQEHQPAGARALAAGLVARLVRDRELREERRFASESPARAAASCGLRWCASRPGESTREGSRASLSSSIIGRPFSPRIRRASRRTTRSSPARSFSCCPRVIDRGRAWCGSMCRTAGRSPAASMRRTIPTVFTAPEYDTLVDQPTLMGQFDVTRFMVDGKPHDFVATPRRRVLGGEDPDADRTPHEAGGDAGQDLRWPAVSEVRLLLSVPARRSECAGCWSTRTRSSPSVDRRRSGAARSARGAGIARVLPRLERQAHPSGGDVAL